MNLRDRKETTHLFMTLKYCLRNIKFIQQLSIDNYPFFLNIYVFGLSTTFLIDFFDANFCYASFNTIEKQINNNNKKRFNSIPNKI